MSISTRRTDGEESIPSDEIIYRRLSFEDDLFTARVYKRNYRNPLLLRNSKAERQKNSGTTTSLSLAVGKKRSIAHEGQSRPKWWRYGVCPAVTELQADDSGQTANLDHQLTPMQEKDRTMFMDACKDGDLQAVQSFLKAGHDICSAEGNRGSLELGAIHVAVRYGRIDIVETLWLNGASLEDRTASIGFRPLHLAVKSRNAEMVKLLLCHGAQVSAENRIGEQPIHLAAKYGSTTILDILLSAGAGLEHPDQSGRQPLYCASESANHPAVVEHLASLGSDINARRTRTLEDRPLDAACRRGFLGNVWALLKLGAETNSGCKYEDLPALRALLKKSIDPIPGIPLTRSKLHSLLSIDPQEIQKINTITKVLVAHGADPNAVDDDGNTVLHLIAQQSKLNPFLNRFAEALLDSGANPNSVDRDGRTPLAIHTYLGGAPSRYFQSLLSSRGDGIHM